MQKLNLIIVNFINYNIFTTLKWRKLVFVEINL